MLSIIAEKIINFWITVSNIKCIIWPLGKMARYIPCLLVCPQIIVAQIEREKKKRNILVGWWSQYTYTIKYNCSNIMERIIGSLLFNERDRKQERSWLIQNNDNFIRCNSKLPLYEYHPRFFLHVYLSVLWEKAIITMYTSGKKSVY